MRTSLLHFRTRISSFWLGRDQAFNKAKSNKSQRIRLLEEKIDKGDTTEDLGAEKRVQTLLHHYKIFAFEHQMVPSLQVIYVGLLTNYQNRVRFEQRCHLYNMLNCEPSLSLSCCAIKHMDLVYWFDSLNESFLIKN